MSEKITKLLLPVSIIVVGIIIAGTLVYLDQGKNKETENMAFAQQIAEKSIGYINENFNVGDNTASLMGVEDVGSGVYKIKLKIGEQEYESYASKDGRLLFPEGYELEEATTTQETEDGQQQSSIEGSISTEGLIKFIICIEKADFVIYGANWCGWTQKLVEMFGGFDMVTPIYVECTEEAELCEEKGVTAYPTVLIKDVKYQGARTFEEIAITTGCELPSGAEFLKEDQGEGGCN